MRVSRPQPGVSQVAESVAIALAAREFGREHSWKTPLRRVLIFRNFQKFGWQLRIGLWDQFLDPESAPDRQNQRGATWCAR